MNTIIKTFAAAVVSVLFLATSAVCDPGTFPTSGLDAKSLGRGGTVIASPPGVSAAFGNPATLVPDGSFGLGGDYINDRDAVASWSASIVDTSSAIRGAFCYLWKPEFADFEKNAWGVSFAQDLTTSLVIGESYHRGIYEPEGAPGTEASLWAVDIGLLFTLGDTVSLGYVSHNLYEDSDLLEPFGGFGIGLNFPWTIQVTADYEEAPYLDKEYDLRAGVQFTPVGQITGRFGLQELADGSSLCTAGISYVDVNGSVDAAILYNNDEKRTQRVIIGLTMGI